MIKLIEVKNSKDTLIAVFNVSHDNGKTTVDQNLILTKKCGKWTAELNFDEFPKDFEDVEGAIMKMGDWLTRLGSEIKENTFNFNDINLNDI